MTNTLLKRVYNTVIKVVIAGLLLYLLYHQIWADSRWVNLKSEFLNHLHHSEIVYLLIVLILMPLNWLLETKKWQTLCTPFEEIEFSTALKAVVAGITMGVITPSRIGEYGGRMLFLRAENKFNSVIATFIGSLSQNIHTVIFGMIAGLVFFRFYFPINRFALASLIGFSLAGIVLMLWLFYRIEVLILLVRKLGIENKPIVTGFVKKIEGWSAYSDNKLNSVFLISLLRYIVYTIQYVLILKFFGVQIPLLASVCGVAVIYLFQSGLPLPPILGVLVRGELALFIWSIFKINELSILSATFGLWIINLIIPSLLGMLIILNVDVIKSVSFNGKQPFTQKKLLDEKGSKLGD